MTRRSVLLLLLLPVLGACSTHDVAGPASLLNIRNGNGLTTDAASYELREENGGLAFDLTITLRNATRQPIHIVNCHGILTPTLEKLVDDAWVTYWTGVTPLCLSPPIVVGRGESYTRELRLWGALPGRNEAPAWAGGDVPGTYRLVLHGLVFNYDEARQGFGEPVPVEYRTSNLFALIEP
jgi:hypothetical protein